MSETNPKGYLALVLHAHLPYVRHPEYQQFLEEDWLFEAITESYVPLLWVLEGLEADRVPFRLTMSITPPLASMLADSLLQHRYSAHIDKLVELAEKEIHRTRWTPEFNRVAKMYRDRFAKVRETFHGYGRNLVGAYRRFRELGHLEIMASAATHGYLPLMEIDPRAIRAQIAVGVNYHKSAFGEQPVGFWLPECGWNPGDDRFLSEFGIRYFICDSHGILFAKPRPKYGVHAPIYTQAGVAAFGRDWETSKQVWSANEGYPGDYDYREFYRDIGHDLEYEYVKPYLKDGIRTNTGIKYYRITGRTNDKMVYDPEAGREKAATHAGNFMFNRERQIEYLARYMDKPPIVVAPYDAELFGHWWFEGPQWLDYVIRKMAYDQNTVELITPGDYLKRHPVNQVSTPCMSSWGYKGYNEVWLEGSNDWIYRHLHKAAERMAVLADTHPNPDELTRRALNQATRELLLAQSSDWAFIMKTGTMVSYAKKRTVDHIGRFTSLFEQITSGNINGDWLAKVESRVNIFLDLDYRIYAKQWGQETAIDSLTGVPAADIPAGDVPAGARVG